MKNLLLVALLILVSPLVISSGAVADNNVDEAIYGCLKKWPDHPFNAKSPEYRTIATKVKVLGIGGSAEADRETAKPELVLVKPGVAVLSKSTYNLTNPNGWYCVKGKVSVLGKIEINLACTAKISTSDNDTEVLGSSDAKSGGVAVLGSVRLNRMCK